MEAGTLPWRALKEYSVVSLCDILLETGINSIRLNLTTYSCFFQDCMSINDNH